jgi:DNA processing protein
MVAANTSWTGKADDWVNDPQRVARVALACLVQPGNPLLNALISECGPVDALAAISNGSAPGRLLDAAAWTQPLGDDPTRMAKAVLMRTAQLGARLIVPEDAEWPTRLTDLDRLNDLDRSSRGPLNTDVGLGSANASGGNVSGGNVSGDASVGGGASRGGGFDRETHVSASPVCLWARGPLRLADAVDRSVAIVGSRACTAYGAHVATDLGYGLAGRGWTVVSGGGYGVDVAAHRGALAAGGVTAVVLAGGVDRVYPAPHLNLFEQISQTGLLVSEWPPGTEPRRSRLLTRSRLLAALTRGTVVVEAAVRSGARRALRTADALGRAAMVVPGPVSSAMSAGCHEEIRAGARLVTNHQEILEEILEERS